MPTKKIDTQLRDQKTTNEITILKYLIFLGLITTGVGGGIILFGDVARWVVFAVMSLVMIEMLGIGYVFLKITALTQEETPIQEQSPASAYYENILTDADEEMCQQFAQLDDELLRLEGIQTGAIKELFDGFTGLGEQSSAQISMVTELTQSIEEPENNKGHKGFKEEATELIALFVSSIQAMSEGSLSLVDSMNSMSENIQAVQNLLGEMDGISAQTNLLALNAAIEAARAGDAGRGFAVVADEVRALSSRSAEFSSQIRDNYQQILKTMNDAKMTIGKLASSDLDLTLTSQGRMDQLMTDLDSQNKFVSNKLSDIFEVSAEIQESVDQALLGLQFEDMTKQLLEHMGQRVAVVKSFVDAISLLRQDFNLAQRDDLAESAEQHLNKLTDAMDIAHQLSQRTLNNPVTQDSMNNGEIEFF